MGWSDRHQRERSVAFDKRVARLLEDDDSAVIADSQLRPSERLRERFENPERRRTMGAEARRKSRGALRGCLRVGIAEALRSAD